jgi:hypothetical protein
MHIFSHRRIFFCISFCLLFLLAACGTNGINGTTGSSTRNGAGQSQTSVVPTTQTTSSTSQSGQSPATATVVPTSPQLQTTCPAAGHARTPIMPSATLGQDQNIVYVANTNVGVSGNVSHSGALDRYDVTTGKTATIEQPSDAVSINDAQLSANGQWVIFIATVGQSQRLELVRVDGETLQVLYCSSSIYDLQWSVNDQVLAFVSYDNQANASVFYLLNMQNGSLQRVFHPLNDNSNGLSGYSIVSWLDATRMYVLTQPLDQPASTLSILDTTHGSNQNSSNLQQVFQVPNSQAGFCWSSDSSYDGSKLFLTQCQGGDPRGGGTQGPSSLSSETAEGGTAHTLFTSQTMALTTIRAISSNTLLLIVGNAGTNADTSHNGLWKIQSDGTELTQLTSDDAGVSGGPSLLNQFNQYPWSNVSRNGNLYALQHNSANNKTVSLLYGSLSGGTPTTFASLSNSTTLSVVGWTTL